MDKEMELPNEDKYLQAFQELVVMKYKLYNGLFLTLPFEYLGVGIELPVFAQLCRTELQKGKNPEQIIKDFFATIVHTTDFTKKIKILILIMQFVERQVVLFDAAEDAAFKNTHDLTGPGSLAQLINRAIATNKLKSLNELLQTYRTRIVLTAHPTQFYPPQVLSIIRDMTEAVGKNNIKKIHDLLLQMGMTPFKREQKPTPNDEADILIQYLEHIFYPVLKNIHYSLSKSLAAYHTAAVDLPSVIELGFWPGGDRDGNPNVSAAITLQVAAKLKLSILDIYLQEIEKLQHQLTFRDVWEQLEKIRDRIEKTKNSLSIDSKFKKELYSNSKEFEKDLMAIRQQVITYNQGLFAENIDQLLSAVQTFGFYFASMDLRQDSHIHITAVQKILHHLAKKNVFTHDLEKAAKDYLTITEPEKIHLLEELLKKPTPASLNTFINQEEKQDVLFADVFNSLKAAQKIQDLNGEKGLHRYIISHTEAPSNLLEILLLAHWSNWSLDKLSLDIVPLFESITDLKNADIIMQTLYENKTYQKHLKRRHGLQTIMLGFSDGTKDGGYVTANWEIFKCKKRLSDLSKKYNVDVVFFDGRGGPPARGGGNTHKFYRAIENMIQQRQVQLTIQGQTISTMYGTKISAMYNIEQLFTSGLSAELFPDPANIISNEEFNLIDELSNISYSSYTQLKNDALFIPYLEKITPLKYYGELNIASRPPRRNQTGPLNFNDLRAIPFVGAWSQMRQNVPGYYGLGSALKILIDEGKEQLLKHLYQHSLFFHTLLENAMQSLDKSFFELTHYLKADKEFGEFWQKLYDEAELTVKLLKRIASQKKLLESEPLTQASIKIREDIVLPLLVIQQYALMKLRDMTIRKDLKSEQATVYKKIILKSLAANINANRESA